MHVGISGSSTTLVGGEPLTVTFTCEAPLNSRQFAIPTWVLMALPTGDGSLEVGSYTDFLPFSAVGLDVAVVSGGNVTYKPLSYN